MVVLLCLLVLHHEWLLLVLVLRMRVTLVLAQLFGLVLLLIQHAKLQENLHVI
jgi:hypothetical protein